MKCPHCHRDLYYKVEKDDVSFKITLSDYDPTTYKLICEPIENISYTIHVDSSGDIIWNTYPSGVPWGPAQLDKERKKWM